MAEDDLMKIRITADFKEAEGAFLKMAKVATAFESDFKRIASGLNKEFNKINGMAELFGNSTNVVKDKMDALKRSMEQLMTLGLQPMNPQVQKLKAQYDALAVSLNNTTQATNKTNAATQNSATTAKKTNQQWTNLALVIQDLPYGFRGIQNNLPALLGGLAGVGGVAYLAFSAIIAGLTFWDEHNRKVAASSKKLKEEEDAVIGSLSNEAVKVNELIIILENENETRDRKKRALKELQGINPDVFKDLKLEGDKVKNLNTFYDTYIENIKNVILLRKYEKDLEALVQAELKTGHPLKVQQQKGLKKTTDLLTTNTTAVKDNITTAKVSYGADQNIIKGINNYNNRKQKTLDLLEKIKKISPSIPLAPGDTDKGGGGGAAKGESYAEKVLQGEIKAKESEVQLSKDDYNQKSKLQLELLGLQKKYDLLKLQNTKFTEKEKGNIALEIEKEYANKILLVHQQTNDSIFKSIEESYENRILLANGNLDKEKVIYEEEVYWLNKMLDAKFISQEEYEKKVAVLKNKVATIDKKQLDDKERDAKEIADREFKNKMSAISNELKAKLKANRKEPAKQAANYADAIASYTELGKQAGLTAQQIDTVGDAINSTNAAAEGTADAFTPMADILNNLATNTLVEFGTQLGNMLSGGEFSLNGFLTLLADAIIEIGKHLLIVSGLFAAVDALFKAPGMWPVAIAVGVAAIAAGTALKNSASKKNPVSQFANGGIISGPTMGLMGEYPGAKSNPEVVAPLDKLKNLIGGGGGGTLEARISGNDLLILMNKAQRNNNTTF